MAAGWEAARSHGRLARNPCAGTGTGSTGWLAAAAEERLCRRQACSFLSSRLKLRRSRSGSTAAARTDACTCAVAAALACCPPRACLACPLLPSFLQAIGGTVRAFLSSLQVLGSRAEPSGLACSRGSAPALAHSVLASISRRRSRRRASRARRRRSRGRKLAPAASAAAAELQHCVLPLLLARRRPHPAARSASVRKAPESGSRDGRRLQPR